MMKKIVILLCMVCCIVACAKKDGGKILATIDNEVITLEEFNRELDKIPTNMKMLVASESGKKSYLDRLIVKKLLLREASKEKIEKQKDFEERLADLREQLIIESLLKKKIAAESTQTNEDLKQYYEKNKERFKREREINTRHILLKTEEEAKQVLNRLVNGEDFVELARQYSIDPNAKSTGGEIGFHPKGSLLPEYEAEAFKLNKIGQVSGIVKTQFGYHIIRLEGVRPPSYVPFDEVKDFIKQQISQEKQKEIIEKYIEDLKKSAKITINDALLKDEKKDEKAEKQETPAGKEATPSKK
jgi:peptidyl-prolyl cis-trans isomerase C